MTDPLAPDDALRRVDPPRVSEPADNVYELRRAESGRSSLGHPSGPRSSAAMSGSARSVDDALASLRPAPSTGDILRQVRAERPDPSSRVRRALAVLSIAQLAIALAWLVGEVPFGTMMGSPTSAHLSRDAALGVVLGSIGAVVSWRPRWSLSLVPIVGAIVAVQAIGLIADGSSGQSGFHFELPHVLAVCVGALIFLVSRRRTGHAVH